METKLRIKQWFTSRLWLNIKIKDKTMSKRYPHLFSESKMLRLAHKSGK